MRSLIVAHYRGSPKNLVGDFFYSLNESSPGSLHMGRSGRTPCYEVYEFVYYRCRGLWFCLKNEIPPRELSDYKILTPVTVPWSSQGLPLISDGLLYPRISFLFGLPWR